MKILVISRNAWDDTNSIGNTLSNFFSGIDDVEFANIYFRSSVPNNQYCRDYYQTSEIEVIKKWFTPGKIGKRFAFEYNGQKAESANTVNKEKTVIQFIQNHNIKLAYKLSDYIWYSEKWINSNLKSFIESYAPDMMFTFVKSAPQYYLTVKYLRENFKIPLFSWIADDEYTSLIKNGSYREIRNLRYILDQSSVVKGCSQEMCDYYHAVFGCEATPLYKGCDLSISLKDSVNTPLKLVYAGNLLYGRLDIIRKIALFLDNYDPTGKKVTFEIYSNTLISSDQKKFFEEKCCTQYLGNLEYDMIKRRLSTADIVLYVESFDDEQILKTKYSFSTKIIDYLQSGSVLLAIGPKEVASMKYIQRIPGAYLIDNLENLQNDLILLLEDSDNYKQRAASIKSFAKCNHSSEAVAKGLKETFSRIVAGGN